MGTIKEEVLKVDEALSQMDPLLDKEYSELLEVRGKLIEQESKEAQLGVERKLIEQERNLIEQERREVKANQKFLDRLDPNITLKAATTVIVAGAIMVFEVTGHIFTSKATSFLPKLL